MKSEELRIEVGGVAS